MPRGFVTESPTRPGLRRYCALSWDCESCAGGKLPLISILEILVAEVTVSGCAQCSQCCARSPLPSLEVPSL